MPVGNQHHVQALQPRAHLSRGKQHRLFIQVQRPPFERVGAEESRQEGEASHEGQPTPIGTVGDHGLAILATREGLDVGEGLRSDTAPLHDLLAGLLSCGADVHFLRDPTRGGVAAVLHELVEQSAQGVILQEAALPLSPGVRGASEILGLDPLHVANEGKCVIVVAGQDAEAVLANLRSHPLGRDAAIIGEVVALGSPQVLVAGPLGTLRALDEPSGAPLPRIC